MSTETPPSTHLMIEHPETQVGIAYLQHSRTWFTSGQNARHCTWWVHFSSNTPYHNGSVEQEHVSQNKRFPSFSFTSDIFHLPLIWVPNTVLASWSLTPQNQHKFPPRLSWLPSTTRSYLHIQGVASAYAPHAIHTQNMEAVGPLNQPYPGKAPYTFKVRMSMWFSTLIEVGVSNNLITQGQYFSPISVLTFVKALCEQFWFDECQQNAIGIP